MQKAWLFVLLGLVAGCTAPRAIINSGKVTAPGQFKAGINFGGNIATAPIGQLGDITKAAVDAIRNRDSVFYDSQIDVASKAMMAYALDPVGPTFDFYLRYGLVERVDVGYKYATGVHVFDAMYQFMGSTGTIDNPGVGSGNRWYGSFGLQYAGQGSGILDAVFLKRLQPVLQFTAKRRDLTIPLIFSKSFGPEEEKGNVSFGVVYSHTFINYGFDPSGVYERIGRDAVEVPAFSGKNNFSSFGMFLNAKFGFKYVYLLPALSIYYQNYGTYQVLNSKSHSYSGLTFIPSLGVQASFGKRR
ncbi:hypothetical protein FVR03_18270 [Pontibacter qinzhouensis]|uniref:Uncharacterized protein n=1 Tax=Pontibacter qinzhouensis TaxID=2603253 RepID=A0A5C8JB09_9BACT|nr:hypothetical protein [Pontibacter qinzhouensis]TXK33867.1 hypothetical protein FVR03_18270 [Pontibacter qinzhouensis]